MSKFEWGKTDNLPSTRLKYDLEAKHWMRGFKAELGGATARSTSGYGIGFGLIVGLFSIAVYLAALFFYGLFRLLIWFFTFIGSIGVKEEKKDEPKTE